MRVQTLRVKYWEQVREVAPENLIFIDETGVNLTVVRSHARAFGGKRAYGERPYYHSENITLFGAIGLSGWVGAMTLNGGTNGDTFRFFLENILVPNLWEGACVVMDNLPAHKVKGIRELIEQKGAKLVYLSPYSPDFNPIENCWSKIKEFLRCVAARSRDALEEAISTALDTIVSNDIRNYFTHCCYCIPLS